MQQRRQEKMIDGLTKLRHNLHTERARQSKAKRYPEDECGKKSIKQEHYCQLHSLIFIKPMVGFAVGLFLLS